MRTNPGIDYGPSIPTICSPTSAGKNALRPTETFQVIVAGGVTVQPADESALLFLSCLLYTDGKAHTFSKNPTWVGGGAFGRPGGKQRGVGMVRAGILFDGEHVFFQLAPPWTGSDPLDSDSDAEPAPMTARPCRCSIDIRILKLLLTTHVVFYPTPAMAVSVGSGEHSVPSHLRLFHAVDQLFKIIQAKWRDSPHPAPLPDHPSAKWFNFRFPDADKESIRRDLGDQWLKSILADFLQQTIATSKHWPADMLVGPVDFQLDKDTAIFGLGNHWHILRVPLRRVLEEQRVPEEHQIVAIPPPPIPFIQPSECVAGSTSLDELTRTQVAAAETRHRPCPAVLDFTAGLYFFLDQLALEQCHLATRRSSLYPLDTASGLEHPGGSIRQPFLPGADRSRNLA
jgi:hypothetical protein